MLEVSQSRRKSPLGVCLCIHFPLSLFLGWKEWKWLKGCIHCAELPAWNSKQEIMWEASGNLFPETIIWASEACVVLYIILALAQWAMIRAAWPTWFLSGGQSPCQVLEHSPSEITALLTIRFNLSFSVHFWSQSPDSAFKVSGWHSQSRHWD